MTEHRFQVDLKGIVGLRANRLGAAWRVAGLPGKRASLRLPPPEEAS